MLRVDELRSRTYEERMEDVLRELPIRSSEWTNYNASDPGITILENLTLFSAILGSDIVTLSYRARMALLKMAGFIPTRGKCSKVLLSADHLSGEYTLKSGERFHLGDLCFETNKETLVGHSKIIGVFSYDGKDYTDLSYSLDREITIPAKIFGKNPKSGNSVYFMIDKDPSGYRELIFYVNTISGIDRNRTEDRTEHIFADIDWDIYTAGGFVPVSVKDYTSAFVNSGEIRISLSEKSSKPAVYKGLPGGGGYCIRATLKRAQYDIVPKVTNIFGFLFEVWQKDTRAFVQTFNKNDRVNVYSPIGDEVYYTVFCKEEKGSSYRRYELSTTLDRHGRFCTYQRSDNGSMTFSFDEEACGFAPIKTKECVRVVVYNEEIMRRYNVGKVVGYDDQEIDLPVEDVVIESFCLIAKRKTADGDIYDFVRPEKSGKGALYYHLLEGDGKIIIEDPGDFIDADLFMGSVATMAGDRGNISAGSSISIDDESIENGFYNPGEGTGGCFRENLDQVKDRFLKDMKIPYRAVTGEDYEYIAKTTPGLCIRKAKAVMDENKNTVMLTVLPDSDEKFPKLSSIYIDKITTRLSERRLITSKFTVVKPSYVAISAKCTVYVKRHFRDCKAQIESRIKSRIDYINSDRNFGDILMFEDVFHAIEDLDCVEYVYDLSLRSDNNKLAQLREYDIYPRFDTLCYPGEIEIEIVTADT
ncbi:MAG: baseplate J/gp47 family protein [Butyrivibrio sp.]|nr:baseplate J/gp47 family protein [Butyrivibrio sp.]